MTMEKELCDVQKKIPFHGIKNVFGQMETI